jgi:hypothetical protein
MEENQRKMLEQPVSGLIMKPGSSGIRNTEPQHLVFILIIVMKSLTETHVLGTKVKSE